MRSLLLCVAACSTAFQLVGTGLEGSGGFTPILFGTGSSCMPGGHTIDLWGALGNAPGTLWVGVGSTSLPLWGGQLYVNPALPYTTVPIFARGAAGVPGTGTLVLPGGDLRAHAGLTLYLQAALTDPGAVRGISMSNGLSLSILP